MWELGSELNEAMDDCQDGGVLNGKSKRGLVCKFLKMKALWNNSAFVLFFLRST